MAFPCLGFMSRVSLALVVLAVLVAATVLVAWVFEAWFPESALSTRMLLAPPSHPSYARDARSLSSAFDGLALVCATPHISGAPATEVAVVLHGRSCDAGFFMSALCPPPPGCTVVCVEYPGFGVWDRVAASEARCVAAARRAVSAVVRRFGAANTTVMGHSLGSAIALLAVDALPPSQRPTRVVLTAAFPSIRALAQYNFGAVGLLVHEAFPAGHAAARLGATTTGRIRFEVHHTRHDLLIDQSQGALVARALRVPLQLEPGDHGQYAFFTALWPGRHSAPLPLEGRRWTVEQ
jgi:pimeloyl-ACP methyl ester carboxylesterase